MIGRITKHLRMLYFKEHAVSSIEYAMWAGMISVIIVVSVTSIGKSVSTMFGSVATSI